MAYEVARRVRNGRLAEGATSVGRKIGFTNREMWRVYGVSEPIWAHVYDATVVRLSNSRGRCCLGRFTDPRIEPEIVVHFQSAPPTSEDPAEILECIDWIAHGLEIVHSPFPGWTFQAADAIAADGFHGTLLVGEPQYLDQLDPDLLPRLEQFVIALLCDGEVRDRGRGSNVLGSPLSAVVHLIAAIANQPGTAPLQAGELVTTGSLTAAQVARQAGGRVVTEEPAPVRLEAFGRDVVPRVGFAFQHRRRRRLRILGDGEVVDRHDLADELQ